MPKKYPKTVRRSALTRIRNCEHIDSVSTSTGVPTPTLRRWAADARVSLHQGVRRRRLRLSHPLRVTPVPSPVVSSEMLAAIDLLLESAAKLRQQLAV